MQFGPEDYFALMCVAFVTVSATFGDSPVRGLTSLFIGLLLGLVGIDILTGQARLTFGVPELLDGIEVTTLAVGLFAVGEALYVASRRHIHEEKLEPVRGSLWMTKEDWKRSWKPWLRGTAFGFPIGALPAGGAEIPTFLSYSTEKRLTKHPEEFGKGAIEGVAGPEAANNASAAGTLVPLLTLGLPTSATAAMMLAGFQQYGLNPGPAAVRREAGPRLGPDRQPVHRQRRCCWCSTCRWSASGCGCSRSRSPGSMRASWSSPPWARSPPTPRWSSSSMLAVFGVLGFLMRRFDFPIAPVAHRRPSRHRRRRSARHRPGADRGPAPADHLQARSGRLDHHVRRHLLRRHVWRLDHRDPDQHAGRERLHGDGARRQQDGQGRPRRPGAGHRRHRLLRGRHLRDAGTGAARPLSRRHRRELRAGGLLRADVSWPSSPSRPPSAIPPCAASPACSSASCSASSASTSSPASPA